jgi:hypothetical protein
MAFAAFGLRPFVSVVEQVNALLFLQYTIHVAAGLKIV